LLASAAQSPARAIDVNIVGFTNLLEAMAKLGVPRLVWTSSSTVYGPAEVYRGEPVHEETPQLPTTVYGGTKAFCEVLSRHYRRERGVETVAVRLPFVYGPRRWYAGNRAAIHRLFHAAARGIAAEIRSSNQQMDLLYAVDAGRALEVCVSADQLPHDRYNVVGHRNSVPDLVEAVRAARPDLQVDVEVTRATGGLPPMNDGRIRHDLGFHAAFDAKAAARDYLEWLQERVS
jgi:nucleoside-diphosphate-sugar epimerase